MLYRIYSIGIAFLFFWILFGEIRTATGYTLVLELIKVVQYYCFEMMWREIPASWFKAAVVETGSFTTAARQFSVPASSLSRRVADLENSFGATLLQRSTSSVQLTPGVICRNLP